jgi:hypothetical protein
MEKDKMRMILLSALFAVGVGFAGTSAASATDMTAMLKTTPVNASSIELSARTCTRTRHCWWRHGHKVCEWRRHCW